MRKPFAAVLAAVLFALAGCESGTASEQYPFVGGTYDVSAPVTEISGARFTGTLTVVDDDATTPEFDGTYTLTLLGSDGAKRGGFTGSMVDASISTAGSVRFDLNANNFRWRGNLADNGTMSGTWILVDGTTNYTGSFLALRR